MTLLQRFLAGMTVHLVKLCVGCDTVQELKDWQTERLKRLKRAGTTPEHCHRTSQTPRRRDELLDGGSLYWVIKGVILVRQRVLDLRPDVKADGICRRPTHQRISAWSRTTTARYQGPCARTCASFASSIFRGGRHVVDQAGGAEMDRAHHARRSPDRAGEWS